MPIRNRSGPRILVVEDERDAAESVRLILEKWCSIVDVHIDAMQTVSQFKAGFYDLVILDYLMPKMNGFELYNVIRAIDPHVKVCIMTAFEIMASETRRKEFEQLNPPLSEENILTKPFDGKALFSKLWQLLDGRVTARSAQERSEYIKSA